MFKACSTDDTNIEAIEQKISRRRNGRKVGVRTLIIAYEGPLGLYETDLNSGLRGAAAMIAYGMRHPGRRRRIPVDVPKMVELWAEVIPALALAHDVDDRDAAEARIDELLTPMLSAPVAQLREFYANLITRLKADSRVPFMIWRSFEFWHDQFVKNAPDEAIKKLKKGLATDITDMVEEKVRPDLREAMIRALMWRDPGQLREVKSALKEAEAEGVRPRVAGRQSCLFLQVPRKGSRPAEIML